MDENRIHINPLMGTLKLQSNGPSYGDWYTGH